MATRIIEKTTKERKTKKWMVDAPAFFTDWNKQSKDR